MKRNKERTVRDAIVLPVPERYCTDKLCLILILLSWFAMTLIGLCSLGYIKSPYLGEGNPELLLRGVDYEGNICGYDEPNKQLPYKVMPNFLGTTANNAGDFVPQLLAVCVSKCPSKGDGVIDPYGTYGSWIMTASTSNVLNNCLFVDVSNLDNTSGVTVMSDFIRSYHIMAPIGFGLSIVCCLLFLFLIRIPLVLRTIVWFCVALIFGMCLFGSYILLARSHSILRNSSNDSSYDQNKTEITLLNFTGGTLAVCAALWLLFICYMRQRIALAISLIRESSHALVSMPLLCFLPLVQSGLFAAFTAIWLLYSVYLISSGDISTQKDPTTGYNYKIVTYNEHSKQAIVFMVFVWFWSVGFLESLGQLVVSHVVLVWYFAVDRRAITSLQVVRSSLVVGWYHAGSAAFGSIIIALLRSLRVMLEYLKMKMTAMSTDTNTRHLPYCNATCVARYVCCCVGCLLWLFEKSIKFLNKHAYIQTAMFGTTFCVSARRAYFMIMRNLGRIAAISVVGDFVVLVGKISITMTCAGLAYIYLNAYMYNEVNSVLLPCMFVGFIAFTTSTLFLGTLSAVCDSMLQATIVDEELSLGVSEINHKGLKELVIAQQHVWQELNTEEEFYVSAAELADEDEEESSDDEEVEVELRKNDKSAAKSKLSKSHRDLALQNIFKERRKYHKSLRGSTHSNESVDSENGEQRDVNNSSSSRGVKANRNRGVQRGEEVRNALSVREVELGVFGGKKITSKTAAKGPERPARTFGGPKYSSAETESPPPAVNKNSRSSGSGVGSGKVKAYKNPFDEDYEDNV